MRKNLGMELRNIFSSFAATDLDVARTFYQDTLGLPVETNEMGILQISFEGNNLIVYPKADHQPANFTVLNLEVADIDAAVDELVAKGVTFERYDGIEMDDKNISRGNGPTIAWFTDPSGNIMSVIESPGK